MSRNQLAASLFFLVLGCAHPGLRAKAPAPVAVTPASAIAARPAVPCDDEARLRDDSACPASEDEAPSSEPLALGGLRYSSQRVTVGNRGAQCDGLENLYRGGERSGVASPPSLPS